MKFEIKRRFTGAVKFTTEIEAQEDAPASVKLRLAVLWAIENKVDLSGSDLSGSDLSNCNLRGSNLSDCDLRGSNLRVLQTDIWTVYVQKDTIRIGCQYHSISDWGQFTDGQIANMHRRALIWWKIWKDVIFAIHATI